MKRTNTRCLCHRWFADRGLEDAEAVEQYPLRTGQQRAVDLVPVLWLTTWKVRLWASLALVCNVFATCLP